MTKTTKLTHIINSLIAKSWFADLEIQETFLLKTRDGDRNFAVMQEDDNFFVIKQLLDGTIADYDDYEHFIFCDDKWFQMDEGENN